MELPVEELTMFVDAPMLDTKAPLMYVAAQEGTTGKNSVNKMGVCSEYASNQDHVVYPIFDAKQYLVQYKKGPNVILHQNGNIVINTDVEIKILKSLVHGRLKIRDPHADVDSVYKFDFVYTLNKNYIGEDNFQFLVSVDGKNLRIYYQVKVFPEDENFNKVGFCNWAKQSWKISLSNPKSQADFTNWQASANLRVMLADARQVGIKNNAVKPHAQHIHFYLKPPAPQEIAKDPQSMTADFASWDDAVEDANNEQKELVQAGSSSLVKKKFDKIVSECTMARTYANDSTHPAGTAQGQYAHGYEENQKLKVLNLEVVTKPKHGDLILVSTNKDSRGGVIAPYFTMVAHSVDYIGEDFAEYRVDLSHGKSVLVREYMFWVNKELDSFGGCGVSKKQIREMREYQKKHPEEFKKASVSDNFLLSPTIDAWLQKVDLDDIISSA
jgi:hypothetical protein